MNFESLDGYLLTGAPPKNDVIEALLAARPAAPGAAAFLEGMRRLRGGTPDLTLIALRLVLAGKKADDANVTALRGIVARAKAGDPAAANEYRAFLSSE
ncbi:MAG: hypothetical protein JO030_04060 [Candidatus Eremiobacteraeota bacterium]|nr:hypothetical protein [Candidatus Eremiobacteraeota bacterium]